MRVVEFPLSSLTTTHRERKDLTLNCQFSLFSIMQARSTTIPPWPQGALRLMIQKGKRGDTFFYTPHAKRKKEAQSNSFQIKYSILRTTCTIIQYILDYMFGKRSLLI